MNTLIRTSQINRKTAETDIELSLVIDGLGKCDFSSPINFFNHMINAFTKHGTFNLSGRLIGDVEIDQHHSIEDFGIVLGKSFKNALGDRKGINRAGFFAYPMDEALAIVAIDLSGRPFLQFEASFNRRFCGDLDTDLIEDFFLGFVMGSQSNVVVRGPFGRSDHHKLEAIFKAFGKAMKMACSLDERLLEYIPSTKEVLD